MNDTKTPPEDMPGIDQAYEFVLPSYQWALARFEANNTRLQNLLTAVIGVSLAVPTLAGTLNEKLSFADKPFVLAAITFLAAVAAGAYGRHTGTVSLADPRVLLGPEWLSLSEAEFKHHALRNAAEQFGRSAAAIERKWRYTGYVLALFAVELALLLVWALA